MCVWSNVLSRDSHQAQNGDTSENRSVNGEQFKEKVVGVAGDAAVAKDNDNVERLERQDFACFFLFFEFWSTLSIAFVFVV